MTSMNPIEDFCNKLSQEVGEGLINTTDSGMVFLLSQVLSGAPSAAERMAAACYMYISLRPDISDWPKHDRTTN